MIGAEFRVPVVAFRFMWRFRVNGEFVEREAYFWEGLDHNGYKIILFALTCQIIGILHSRQSHCIKKISQFDQLFVTSNQVWVNLSVIEQSIRLFNLKRWRFNYLIRRYLCIFSTWCIYWIWLLEDKWILRITDTSTRFKSWKFECDQCEDLYIIARSFAC